MKYIWISTIFTAVTLFSKVSSFGEDEDFDEFYSNLNSLIMSIQKSLPNDNSDLVKTNTSGNEVFGSFDFIVIGSGASGGVIANRLSEISNWTVLLLEAGGPVNNVTRPLGLNTNLYETDLNWGYSTVPQKNACQGLDNKATFLPQGKVIGGSTSINGQVYSRGHEEDYNRWQSIYGNDGWSYKDVLPYFKKSENAVFQPRDEQYHGVGGYYTISETNETPGLEPVLIQGNKDIGIMHSIDYNGKHGIGLGKAQFGLKGNERVSSYTAFLRRFENRKNLIISLNSFVTRLIINSNNEAEGVEFIRAGTRYMAKANKEIIVSAGAINSPQILMLSGIGPKEHLQELNITVKKDLPVGKNFQDHVCFHGVVFRGDHKIYSCNMKDLLRLYVKHERPLTAGVQAEMFGYTNFGKGMDKSPDIEYQWSVPALTASQQQKAFKLDERNTNAIKSIDATKDILVQPVVQHPKSRGTIKLKSNDPKDKPLIDPNYLDVEEDVEILYKGIELLIMLNNTKSFQENGWKMILFDYPACRIHDRLTKKWWICAIRELSLTIYHPCGSNKMGSDPKNSVVDSRLKVYGVGKLRVADSSIFPEVPSGHTNAPSLMVGEKAADLIKEDYSMLSKQPL